jgi:hypothetical protein
MSLCLFLLALWESMQLLVMGIGLFKSLLVVVHTPRSIPCFSPHQQDAPFSHLHKPQYEAHANISARLHPILSGVIVSLSLLSL